MKVSKDLLLKMPCHPDGDDCILGGGVDPKYSISPTNTFPGNRRSEKFLFDRKKKEKNTPNSCGEKNNLCQIHIETGSPFTRIIRVSDQKS